MREHKKLKIIADIKAIEPKGDLELAVISTLAYFVIPLFIGAFGVTYKGVNLGVHEHKAEDIVRMLHNDEHDAVLLVTRV